MRPLTLLATVLVAATLALTGCAGSADAERTGPDPSQAPGPGSGVFPVTVEHQFGRTTVAAQPQRVVSVGLTEHDILLQLGVVPVAVTEWYGDQPSATWPWARDLLGAARPTVLTTKDGFPFEQIAALAPDLIVGVNAGMEKADYDKLAAIAPTVTSMAGSQRYFSAWDAQTIQVASALGRRADGEKLVADVKAAYAAAAAAHPEFAGRSATFSQGAPYDGILYVYPDGLSTNFLTDLGFTITPGLDKYQKQSDAQAEISAEVVEVIDADVIVFATEDEKMFASLQDWSTVSALTAVRENRSVYTDGTLAGALYFSTPLSLTYALERLTPQLAQAVRGEAPRAFPR